MPTGDSEASWGCHAEGIIGCGCVLTGSANVIGRLLARGLIPLHNLHFPLRVNYSP